VIDTDRDVRLTIEYRHDGEPVPSVPFDLYYAASVDADANFTLAESHVSFSRFGSAIRNGSVV